MPTTILGLTGKKGSGKDTFAARLVQEHGFTRVAFADTLKNLAQALNPVLDHDVIHDCQVRLNDYLDVYGWEQAKQLPVVRRYMQTLGQAARDHVYPDVWLSAAVQKVSLTPGPVVLTDVRLVNEARWVQSVGELVKIVRPGTDDGDTDISETALDSWVCEHFVVNCSGIDRLHANADAIAENLRVRSLLSPAVRV